MRFLKYLLGVLFIFLCSDNISFAQDTTQHIIPGRLNSKEQQQKPYLILISIDGLRYDLADRFNAQFLKEKRAARVQAFSMKPSFPTLTFPNHYSIATGLYPAHHGIVSNDFFAGDHLQYYYAPNIKSAVQNPGFYGGIPLWVLAEKQKMLSANFYWVGSEAPVDSTYATYFYNYNEAIPIERRITIVREWLQLPEEKRPHLIMFYMPEVDHAIHRYGARSDKVRDAVQLADYTVRRMNEMTDSLNLPVNYILLSDHGMIDVDTANPIRKPVGLDTTKFKMAFGSALINLYARNKEDVLPVYNELKKGEHHYKTFLKKNTPKRWHYRARDDIYNRLGDIILVANPGKAFSSSGGRVLAGGHGYDNENREMQATFYAWGPMFKSGYKIPSFENVNVYPLVAELLGLELLCPVDGKLKVLKKILK